VRIAVFHNLGSGGAKRALYNLTKHLAKAGHAVDAFIPSTAEENFLPLRDVVTTYRVFPIRRTPLGATSSALRRLLRLGTSLRDQERGQQSIAEAINAGSYDVVLSEQDRDTRSPFILRFLTKPTVYCCQQPHRYQEAILDVVSRSAGATIRRFEWLRERVRNYLERRATQLDKRNAQSASYIVTNSSFSREVILRAYGLNAFVSYLGTDTDLFRPLFERREDYVLSVGSCTSSKGYDFLIRSLARIDAQARPKILIAANETNPGWEAYLLRLAATLKVGLSIKKLVSDSDLVRLYNRAKLFLYAPYLEPFGLVVLEAMACGTPVIAVKEGGVRESVLHNETGILTERDEEAFAQATSELLRDDVQRERLARRALEVVRSFWTWKHAAERLSWHLERAVRLGRA
jgi:glycosyltransferase involved in cell wall biosynthesis